MELIGLQTDIAWEERDTNYARVREMLAGARVAPGSLLVLPEFFAVGFSMATERVADRRRESELFLMDLAKRYQSYVIGGIARMVKTDDGEAAANEALVMGPEGNLLSNYRKMHPFALAGEAEHYLAGEEVCLIHCAEFCVAPTICYDLRFPELYRAATTKGAELLVVIANWPIVRIDHWVTLLKARAIENQAYVIGVNRVGQDPGHHYNGKSLIVDPRGQVLAEAGDQATIIRAHADRRVLQDWRMAFPALQDRRASLGDGGLPEEDVDDYEEPEPSSARANLPAEPVAVWQTQL
jgi:omega-amidase